MSGRSKHGTALLSLVAAVVSAGIAATLLSPGPLLGTAPETTALLVAAAAAGSRTVRIPRLRVELVPFHPFLWIALGLSGTRAAMLVGAAGLTFAAASRRPRPAPIRFVFNVAATTLSVAAAGTVFSVSGGRPGGSLALLLSPLAASALAFFLASTGLVAAAISIETRKGYFATWNGSLRWTAWSNLAGLAIAVSALALFHRSALVGLAVALAPCWLLLLFYRAQAGRRGVDMPPPSATRA